MFVDDRLITSFQLTATSCTFGSNTAYTSGGVFFVSSTVGSSRFYLIDSSFSSNSATTSNGGVINS